MKRIYLAIITTITVLCVIIGSVVHVTAFMVRMGKDGDRMFSFGKSSKKVTETLSESRFSDLKIDMDLGNIVIKSGSVANVEWNGSEELKPEVTAAGNDLTIRQKGRKILNSGALNNTLTVTVPEPLGKMEIETDLGNLEADGLTADKAKINLSAGNAIVKGSSFGDLNIEADAGNIELGEVSATKIDLDSDAGNIQGSVAGDFKSLKANTDVGNIELQFDCERSDLNLELKTSLGDVAVNGEKTGNNTKIGSGSSSVNAKTDLGNIKITTK